METLPRWLTPNNITKVFKYRQSAETLRNESRLSKDFAVCDNINLEFIVIEYETYYHHRFQSYPQLCKQRVPVSSSLRTKPIPPPQNSLHVKKPQKVEDQQSLDLIIGNAYSKDEATSQLGPTKLIPDCEEIVGNEWKEYVNVILRDIQCDTASVRLDDIKGLENAKETLKEAIIYPIKYPYLFTGGIQSWKGILLYGPPGTGKTSLARAIATESNATFFNVSTSSIVAKWRGDTEKLIRVLFELAQQHAPSIIFIDEIDSLAFKRNSFEHEASRRMKSELFARMDNLIRSRSNVFFLATTNIPWDLDEAMIRRFEKRILVSYPNKETRMLLFQNYLPKIINTNPLVENTIDYEYASEMTVNFTGSDIKNLCKELTIHSMKEVFNNLESNNSACLKTRMRKLLKNEDLENALQNHRPTVAHLLEKYAKWETTGTKK